MLFKRHEVQQVEVTMPAAAIHLVLAGSIAESKKRVGLPHLFYVRFFN